jgi:hypothetical protein
MLSSSFDALCTSSAAFVKNFKGYIATKWMLSELKQRKYPLKRRRPLLDIIQPRKYFLWNVHELLERRYVLCQIPIWLRALSRSYDK